MHACGSLVLFFILKKYYFDLFCSDVLLDMKPGLIFPALAEAQTFLTPGPGSHSAMPQVNS